jgi:hypothetical protein
LIGLHAHHTDQQPRAWFATPANDFVQRNFFRRLIKCGNLDWKFSEHTALYHILSQAMENIQCVAWQDALPEANDITVIVIFGGLDQNYPKFFK